jgi:hypothetical protein
MDETPPADIPRRLVFRALADILGGQARRLEGLTAARSGDRRGPEAAANSERKRSMRLEQSRRMRADAAMLSGWAGEARRCAGRGVDAAVFGYLVAMAYGHGDGLKELRAEVEDLGEAGLPRRPACGRLPGDRPAADPMIVGDLFNNLGRDPRAGRG